MLHLGLHSDSQTSQAIMGPPQLQAGIRWLSLHGTTLNFEDADDLRRGSDILSLLADEHYTVTNTGDASITFALNWMLNPNRSDFPIDHQLRSCDLTELCGHSILALFLVPNESQAPRSLHMPDSLDPATAWAQMTHHSLRPHGGGEMSPSLTYSLLRGKENSSSYYWPYPTLPEEENRCLSALLSLALNMWDTAQGIYQMITKLYVRLRPAPLERPNSL